MYELTAVSEWAFIWSSVLIEADDGQLSLVLSFVGQEVTEYISRIPEFLNS
jgi:hypothetical protein